LAAQIAAFILIKFLVRRWSSPFFPELS